MTLEAVLTGGPNVGKSTVLRRLEAWGFPVVHEQATVVIERGVYLPWEDHIGFQFEVLRRQLLEEARVGRTNKPLFLDRGTYDAIAYRLVHGWKVQDFLLRLERKRYKVAFMFPECQLWENNGVRYEDPLFTREITPYLVRVYEDNGIPVVWVPRGTPQERAEFILRTLRWSGGIQLPTRNIGRRSGLPFPSEASASRPRDERLDLAFSLAAA